MCGLCAWAADCRQPGDRLVHEATRVNVPSYYPPLRTLLLLHLTPTRSPLFSQLEVVRSVMKGDPLLAILPTGAGKSLCYQLPALLLPGEGLGGGGKGSVCCLVRGGAEAG